MRPVKYRLFNAVQPEEMSWLDRPMMKWLCEHVQERNPAYYRDNKIPYPDKMLWEMRTITNEWGKGVIEFDDSVPDDVITMFILKWG